MFSMPRAAWRPTSGSTGPHFANPARRCPAKVAQGDSSKCVSPGNGGLSGAGEQNATGSRRLPLPKPHPAMRYDEYLANGWPIASGPSGRRRRAKT